MMRCFHSDPFCDCAATQLARRDRIERWKREHEVMARAVARERDANRIASLEQVRFLAREPVVRLGASRVTTGGAGVRARNALPVSFSYYQGSF